MKWNPIGPLARAIFIAELCWCAAGQTNINISSTVLTSGTKKIGINLGGPQAYGSQQLLKNLIFFNAGLQNSYQSSVVPCQTGSTTTCVLPNNFYNMYTSGYWGSYTTSLRVLTGPAVGCTSTVTNYTPNTFTFSALSGNSPVTGSACSTFESDGTDYINVSRSLSASSVATSYNPTFGWQTTSTGSSPTYTTVTDAPPSPDAVSVYTQSLQMGATGSDVAQISTTFDQSYSYIAGRNFVDLNGTYTISFWAKATSGTSPSVNIVVSRNGTPYIFHNFPITTSWAQYTTTFNPTETGNQTGNMTFVVATGTAETIEVNNFSLTEPTTGGNPTVFRDAVVSRLQTLKPGVLRMWDGNGQTNTLDNMIVNQFARAPVNFASAASYPGYSNGITYSINDFLQLCQTLGTEAWIVVPVSFSPADASNLIDYLSGDGTTTYGAKRIAQGFTAPWTSVSAIPKIHLEIGNEQWNNNFAGGSTPYSPIGYAQLVQQLFATMKAKSDYVSAKTSLVLGAQFQGTYGLQILQNNCNNNDEIDVGPYLMNNVSDYSSPNLWQTTLAESSLIYAKPVGTAAVCMEFDNYSGITSPYINYACPTEATYSTGSGAARQYGGGIFAQDLQAEANSSHPVTLAYYETSVDGSGSEASGSTQSQLNSFLPSLGVGLMNIDAELGGIANGVVTQNIFEIGQDDYTFLGLTYLIWGVVEDMGGPTNGNRPTFWAAQLANSAISTGGNMLTTTQTGTPTYSIGSATISAAYSNSGAINTVAGNNIPVISSYAFSGTGGYGLVLINKSATAQAVTFSGANAPAGAVVINTLTSANPADNNESTTTTVVPATTTATSPPSYTLPPYSEVVMTWGGTPAPAVTLTPGSLNFGSQAVGVQSSPQSVQLQNTGTAALVISAVSATGDYAQTNNCGALPATIASSASCTFSVTFTPTASGTRAGALTITDNAGGSPQAAALTGVGAGSSSATYYVSNSGSDSNNGTSAGTPWQTVAKVNAQTLSAGSQVLFQSGGLWREELALAQSGSTSAPITVANYGGSVLPVITGANLTTWSNVSGNVWSTAAATNPLYPNFSGSPGTNVANQSALTAANQWYWDGTSAVTNATNANPIQITTASATLLTSGQSVTIYGVLGNTSANGTFTVTVVDATHFTIPVAGNGAYASGGTATNNSGADANTLYVYSLGTPAGVVEIPARPAAIQANCQSYVTVNGVEVRGARLYGYQNLCATSISNNLIENSVLRVNYSDGLYVAVTGSTAVANNIATLNNKAYSNGASGLKVSTYTGGATLGAVTMTGDAAYDNCRWPDNGSDENTFCGGKYIASPGVQATGAITITGGSSVNNGVNAPAVFRADVNIGQGDWCDTVTTCTISFESITGNTASGLLFEKTVNSVGYRDVAFNNATGGGIFIGNCALEAGFGFQSTNNLLYEVTCGGTGYAGLVLNFETTTSGSDYMSGNRVINSIIGNSGGTATWVNSAQVNLSGYYCTAVSGNCNNTAGKNTVNYNSFGVASTNQFFYNSTFYSTYASFEAQWCASVGCTNSLQTDPKIIGNGDFNLQNSSPARSFGQVLTGYPNLCPSSLPDLGAFPYACNPSASTGRSITFSSPSAVAWTHAGAGTLTANTGTLASSTSVTFTAPATLAANQTMGGCSVLPPDSVFSTNVQSLPVNANSALWLTAGNVGANNINFQPSWGITSVTSSTPTYSLIPYYGDGLGNQPTLSGVPYPGYAFTKTENGGTVSNLVDGGNDHHSVLVNTSTCGFYEIYNPRVNLTVAPFATSLGSCHYSGTNCNVSSAIAPYTSTTFQMPTTSTDAAGLPLAPLTWTLADIKQPGGPQHAARYTTASAYIATSPNFVWPATSANGECASPGTQCAPYGARLVLKTAANGGPNPTTVCTVSSILNQDCYNMMLGLQNYGITPADISGGGSNHITVSSDAMEDPVTRAAFALITASVAVNSTNFYFADLSGLRQSPGLDSFQVSSPLATVQGGNSSVSITLQPIGVNIARNAYAVAPGVTGWQVPYSIQPAGTTQTATWSIASETCTGDSVTSGGAYTAPATASSQCLTTLKAVATADAAAIAYVYLSILPSNTGGSLGVDLGSSTATTSQIAPLNFANDFGVDASFASYPTSPDPYNWRVPWFNSSETGYSTQYGTNMYTTGGSIGGCFVVPNGNYQVRWGQGQDWTGNYGTYPAGSVNTTAWFASNPEYILVNGVIEAHYYDYGSAQNLRYVQQASNTVPARVTNNLLCTSVMDIAPDVALVPANGIAPLYWTPNGQSYPYFSATVPQAHSTQAQQIVLIQDSGAAHLAIDAQQATTISSGQSMVLYPVDWYTGVTLASTTWSVSGAGASVAPNADGSAMLTLATGTYLAGQPISVTATNGAYTASVTLKTAGGYWLAVP